MTNNVVTKEAHEVARQIAEDYGQNYELDEELKAIAEYFEVGEYDFTELFEFFDKAP